MKPLQPQLARLVSWALITLNLATWPTKASNDTSVVLFNSKCLSALNNGLESRCEDTQKITLKQLAQNYYECVDRQQAIDQTKVVRLLVPEGPIFTALNRETLTYEGGNGTPIDTDPSTSAELLKADITSQGRYYDGWVIASSLLPAVTSVNRIKGINTFSMADAMFDWNGVTNAYKNLVPRYGKELYGLPVDGDTMALYYRRDMFAKYNLKVPMTWDQVLAMAIKMNSTDFNEDGQGDYSLCWELKAECDLDTTLGPLLAPMIQTQGTSQGFYLDTETKATLIKGSVLMKGLSVWKSLSVYISPIHSSSCAVGSEVFDRGECLMSISNFKQFAMLRHNTSYARGKVGVAHLPGWTDVLDRTTGTLSACTLALCTHGVKDDVTGQLVNRAPMLGSWTHLAVLSNASDKGVAAYKFLSNALMEGVYAQLVTSGLGPIREKHLADITVWKQHGWQEEDTLSFMATTRSILNDDNLVRAPPPFLDVAGNIILSIFNTGVSRVLYGNNTSDAINALSSALSSRIDDQEDLATIYCDYLNCEEKALPEPNKRSDGDDNTVVILATVLSVFAVLAMLMLLLWLHQRKTHLDWLGRVKPPATGEDTTLVVITLQVVAGTISPSCWSETIRLFKMLVRRQLKVCHGYESTNTAESLVLAFHSSSDALAFATSIQKELLELDWPQELMMLEECRPGYMGRKEDYNSRSNSLVPSKSMSSLGRNARKSVGMELVMYNRSPTRLQDGGEEPEKAARVTEEVPEDEEQHGGSAKGEGEIVEVVGRESGQPRLPGGLRSAEETEVAAEGLGTTSFCEILQEEWGEVNEDGERSILYRRGPPVHIGIHSGLWEDDEVVYDKQTRRMHYTGPCVDCARRVCGACERGAFLLSETAFQGLSKEALGEDLIIFHAGDFRIRGESISLYAALERAHIGILALCNPVKALIQSTPGVLEAPLGQVTIVFMHVVGASTLLSWNAEVAQRALAMFRRDACELLGRMGGYMVEAVDGLLLASFPHPWSALIWCLKVHQAMLHLSWEEELLKHELCEEMTVTNMTDSDNGAEYQEALLFRGLRLKSGLALGVVMGDVNPMTGRMTYRGKVMNRAARISTAASTGQVWCSEGVWHACEDNEEVKAKGIIASSMGYQRLKGVDEKVEVFWCRSKTGTLRASRHNSACSDQSLGSGTQSPKANAPSKANSRHMSKSNSVKRPKIEAALLPFEVPHHEAELVYT